MSRSRTRPSVRRIVELKWNQIANPDVIKRAAIAPVRGHGLGSTMWYACAWWVMCLNVRCFKCFLVSIG